MADNITVGTQTGSGPILASDQRSSDSAHFPFGKLVFGPLDTFTPVSVTDGLPVQPATSSAWVLGAGAAAIGSVTITSIVPGVAATSLGKAEDAAHASGDTGVFVLAVRNDTPGALAGADGDYAPIQVNAAGAVRVDGSQVTQPVSNGFLTAMLAEYNANAGIPVLVANTGGKTEDAVHSSGDTGVYCLAVRKDTAASTAGTDGDYTSLITDSTGHLWVAAVQSGTWNVTNAGTFAVQAALAPATSGGLSVSRLIAAAGSNQDATVAKASAGQVYGWFISNINAAVMYVKIYNVASGATSASTPILTIAVPGNAAGAGTNIEFANGIACGTGISFRITTGKADNDANAVTAGDVIVNLLYK